MRDRFRLRVPTDIVLANLGTHLNPFFLRMVFAASTSSFPIAGRVTTAASFLPMKIIGIDELYLT